MQKRILILENRENFLKIFSGIIRGLCEEIRVFQARNVYEGIGYAMDYTIDLFIVDLDVGNSNVMDGIKFVENIRQQDKYRFTPVIILSSAKDPNHYVYSHLHCYSFFEKPVIVDEMKEKIKEALKYKNSEWFVRHNFFKINGIYYSFYVDDIVCAESHNRELEIKTKEESYRVPYVTCEQFLDKYHSDIFIQCSKCTIVNRNYIKMVDMSNRYIELKNEYGQVEIGPAFKKKIEMYVKGCV